MLLWVFLWTSSGVAATRTVNTLADGRTVGTLRRAITSSLPGDTIVFKRGLRGTLALTNGPLLIRKDLIIRGPGAHVITISGRNRARVFNITNANVTISGLTIANGRAAGKNGTTTNSGAMAFGAGILNLNSAPGYAVTIDGCSFVRNTVRGGNGGSSYSGPPGEGGDAYGGAVFNNGAMSMNKCSFYANTVTAGEGGVSYHRGADGGSGAGGAICNVGIVALTNCTFAMNTARGGTGGSGGGDLFSGYGGTAEGGAVYNAEQLFVVSCTIGSNTTVGGFSVSFFKDGGAYAGGIRNAGENCDIRNTIIARNSGTRAHDVSGAFTSSGFNLVTATNGSTGFGVAFDLVGSQIAPVNVRLGALQSTGPNRIFPLQPDSPALDAGNSFGLTSDQRGTPRPFDIPTVLNSADGTDIGSFELAEPPITALQK